MGSTRPLKTSSCREPMATEGGGPSHEGRLLVPLGGQGHFRHCPAVPPGLASGPRMKTLPLAAKSDLGKMSIFYEPAILLLRIYPKKIPIHLRNDLSLRMLITQFDREKNGHIILLQLNAMQSWKASMTQKNVRIPLFSERGKYVCRMMILCKNIRLHNLKVTQEF